MFSAEFKYELEYCQLQVCFYNFGLITIHGLKTQKNSKGFHEIQEYRELDCCRENWKNVHLPKFSLEKTGRV